ncbi:MAG: hypothetical protein MUO42_06915 [Anaerolineaceae bacterium]|nr:hypothetical protein [Anaerolineaceae bacterium]
MNWLTGLETVLNATSDVLTAGIAVISFSLLIYAIAFKLRDAVTNTFTLLLLCLVVIFGADAFITVIKSNVLLVFVIKIHLLGLILLPTAYFLFSDALLALTGKPSKGKRKISGYVFILISLGFLGLLFSNSLLGTLIVDQHPAPYLERTVFIDIFSIFFVVVMVLSWYNFVRAYHRTVTHTSRRRMVYLIVSAVGPAVGSFPFLLYGSEFASRSPIIFWLLSVIAYGAVAVSVIAMTYAVSFYGFPWTDRVIKSRLFRWVMRGPITASLTLGVTTLLTRLGVQFNINNSAVVALAMVATIVIFEYTITLFAPIWERFFFYGADRIELEKIRTLEDRLLTTNDLKQFLELILASVCDRLQIPGAILIVNNNSAENLDVNIGSQKKIEMDEKLKIFKALEINEFNRLIFEISDKSIIPLLDKLDNENPSLLGAIVIDQNIHHLDDERIAALKKLSSRAVLALRDRLEQEQLFTSLDMLTPQVSIIQDLLASSRKDQGRIINGDHEVELHDLEIWVKDALSQIWGGPKLLENPILQLFTIQKRIKETKEKPLNAVRELLREAITHLRPEGERQYTNEWLLYNLMELKFLEGWKVRDVAHRLALSEADLYRKQRMAITAISRQIIEIEKTAYPDKTT